MVRLPPSGRPLRHLGGLPLGLLSGLLLCSLLGLLLAVTSCAPRRASVGSMASEAAPRGKSIRREAPAPATRSHLRLPAQVTVELSGPRGADEVRWRGPGGRPGLA
ncbi:MAG: hypothetical protein P8R43_05880, partial [Planctomycetota bacterium]|nr:hypothetical protein [Planctomycetota bacterium]